MLLQNTLFGEVDKVQIAIDRIIEADKMAKLYTGQPLYVSFSGGKDSQVTEDLCKKAGVEYKAHYRLTTLDPPELVVFIRNQYPHVKVDYPEATIWQLIVIKGCLPDRIRRWCCAELKEKGGEGRVCTTGVRREESTARKHRGTFEIVTPKKEERMLFNDNEDRSLFETCLQKGKWVVNPIIDWLEKDVWEYLDSNKIKHCQLYDEGFKRLGCIGCPKGSTAQTLEQFRRWPTYYRSFVCSCNKLIEARKAKGKPLTWKTGEEMMDWWIYEMPKADPDQLDLFDKIS
jgi:phosphoadenosine phosphosulfate reductase